MKNEFTIEGTVSAPAEERRTSKDNPFYILPFTHESQEGTDYAKAMPMRCTFFGEVGGEVANLQVGQGIRIHGIVDGYQTKNMDRPATSLKGFSVTLTGETPVASGDDWVDDDSIPF